MAKKLNPSEPGLIRIICPVEKCFVIHRIPIPLDFTANVNEDGELDIYVIPKPDISKLADHMAFEHGLF